MLVHCRVTPSSKFAGTHLYTWVKRGTMRVKYIAQERNAVPQPGLEPGPPDPESSALTIRPPRLPQKRFMNLRVILVQGEIIPILVYVLPLREHILSLNYNNFVPDSAFPDLWKSIFTSGNPRLRHKYLYIDYFH